MENALKELIEKRKRYIEAADENNFTEGLKSLLTDLYPDEAHFIYELLQNAEDMNATEVRFILSEKNVEFEHNGTKRNFNIGDIDAITSIGNNAQKKNDPTSIGKFGVGFKAVFAYTETPEIHSGNYHFRIKNYFLPEVDGVNDKNTNGFTTFSFPFDNPSKPPNIAFDEIKNGLESINENSLLFLNNIEKIEYLLPTGELGYVLRKPVGSDEKVIEIAKKQPYKNNEETSKWLRFQEPINGMKNLPSDKQLHISIAYSLVGDEKAKTKYKIVPIDGGVYIYFPAVKETSNLKFHINAPFASTVARDSVRDCDENGLIIEQIGALIATSFEYIKKQEMLTMSFLAVMPIIDDNVSKNYQIIVKSILDSFKTKEYTPVKMGGFDAANNLIQAPPTISNLISDADREFIIRRNKRWAANAPQNNQREDKFLSSLSMEQFGFSAFCVIITSEHCKPKVEKLLEEKPDKWLKSFYALLLEANDKVGGLHYELRYMRMVRTTDNKLVDSSEAYIIPINTPVVSKDVISVKREVYEGDDKTSVSAYNYLTIILGIKEYNAQIAIEFKLKKYNNREITPDKKYFNDVLSFARFNKRDSTFDFSRYKFLLYEANDETYKATLASLMLGVPYIDTPLQSACHVISKRLLWAGYFEYYNEKECELFVSFCKNLGLEYKIELKKCKANKYPWHPLWQEKLASGRNNNGMGVDVDYEIPNLPDLLAISIEINKLIWITVTRCKANVTEAQYSPNKSAPIKSCESSVVYYLKTNKWIPNKQGVLCAPQEMTKDDLRDDFIYDNQNGFLDAIEFGLKEKLRKSEVAKILKDNNVSEDSDAAKLLIATVGFTKNQMNELLNAVQKMNMQKVKDVVSPLEAFGNETRESRNSDNNSDDETTVIQNKLRRQKKLEEEFRLGLKGPVPINRRLQYTYNPASSEEKRAVYAFYKGKCQMCGAKIIKHNNQPHFHAVNIIRTTEIDDKYNATLKSAWNTLSLCPNCAAEYRYCGGKDITVLVKQLNNVVVEEQNDELTALTIVLDGKNRTIKFSSAHLLAMQVAIKESEEDSLQYI